VGFHEGFLSAAWAHIHPLITSLYAHRSGLSDYLCASTARGGVSVKKPTKSPDTGRGKEKAMAGGAPPAPAEFKRLKLDSVQDIRAAMRKLTRACAQNKLDEGKLRSLVYALAALLNSYKISDKLGGDGIKKLCWDVLSVPEGNLGWLLEFYRDHWWAPYIHTHPQLPHECYFAYLERLKALHGDPMDKLPEIVKERHEIEAGYKPGPTVEEPARAASEYKIEGDAK